MWFGDGETNRTNDARCQTEDLGDDAVKASEYGIKNLQRMLKRLPEWTYESNDIYHRNLSTMYNQVLNQFRRYVYHVIGNLGGVYCDYKTVDQPGEVYYDEPREKQLDAFRFVCRHVVEEPRWLVSQPYLNRLTPNVQSIINPLGVGFISTLTSPMLLNRLTPTYPVTEYLPAFLDALFDFRSDPTSYRQALQRKVVRNLLDYYQTEQDREPWPIVYQQLRRLEGKCKVSSNPHYAALARLISQELDKK